MGAASAWVWYKSSGISVLRSPTPLLHLSSPLTSSHISLVWGGGGVLHPLRPVSPTGGAHLGEKEMMGQPGWGFRLGCGLAQVPSPRVAGPCRSCPGGLGLSGLRWGMKLGLC